ncbi:MAG: SCP2 sterol-binding domain-containing protein [Rhodocyclaceae bacterium]|nr:SCP2 sterol-binding domain-containing protein [Rhodocyclaceae bacterium]
MRLRIPDFTLPAVVARVGATLPSWPPTLALVTALNLALGRLLPRAPLAPLLGKRFALRVQDAGLTISFGYATQGFFPCFDDRPADLVIGARARDFLALLLREEDPDTLFFNRRLVMEGDTDLGLLVKNTLDGVEWPQLSLASCAFALRAFLQRSPASPSQA